MSIPNDILLTTFQFLDYSSLGSISQVCKHWEFLQKNDEIWKTVASNYLDDPGQLPSLNSWKERFKIIRRCMKGEAQIDSIKGCYKKEYKSHEFGFIGNVLIEVRPENSLSYCLMNFPKGQIPSSVLKVFNLEQLGGSRPVCTALSENNWVALDTKSALLCFDLTTGQGVKFIDPDDQADIDFGCMCILQDEIITYSEAVGFKMWDKNNGFLQKNEITLGKIRELCSSKSYIICNQSVLAKNEHVVYAILKDSEQCSEKAIQILTNSGSSMNLQTSNDGTYIALSHEVRALNVVNIQIYKDEQSDIKLIHSIDPFCFFNSELKTFNFSGTLKLYQNWLLANYQGELIILNILSGQLLSQINHNEQGRLDLAFSASALCLRSTTNGVHVSTERRYYENYNYIIYDFGRISPPTLDITCAIQ